MTPADRKYWWTIAAFLAPAVIGMQVLASMGVFDGWAPWLRVVLFLAAGAFASELADMWMKRSRRKDEPS